MRSLYLYFSVACFVFAVWGGRRTLGFMAQQKVIPDSWAKLLRIDLASCCFVLVLGLLSLFEYVRRR